MKKNQPLGLWPIMSLAGIASAVVYTLHVVIGGLLWEGYSHIRQAVSELTATGAPDASLLTRFTAAYGVLSMIFAISLYACFRQMGTHWAARRGALLLIVMETASFAGYSLFPVDSPDSGMNVQNGMHIAVTAVVVACTIGAALSIGAGLIQTPGLRRIGQFTLLCAAIIVFSGAFTPISMANDLPISGLTERINIFTLQIWISVLSVRFFACHNKRGVV